MVIVNHFCEHYIGIVYIKCIQGVRITLKMNKRKMLFQEAVCKDSLNNVKYFDVRG